MKKFNQLMQIVFFFPNISIPFNIEWIVQRSFFGSIKSAKFLYFFHHHHHFLFNIYFPVIDFSFPGRSSWCWLKMILFYFIFGSFSFFTITIKYFSNNSLHISADHHHHHHRFMVAVFGLVEVKYLHYHSTKFDWSSLSIGLNEKTWNY